MKHVEVVIDPAFELGEGPLWDAELGALYGVDIAGQAVWRWIDGEGLARWQLDVMPGALGLRAAGGLIAATSEGFATFDPASGSLQPMVDPEPEQPRNRFNDGAVDPGGRFWAGTMDTAEQSATGSLYCLHSDGACRRQQEGVGISNGLGWSLDDASMYFADTMLDTIFVYDYELDTGSIASRRSFAGPGEAPGMPDGLTVDADGGIWSARWDGGCLARFTDRGELDRLVELPVPRPTSVMFGGSDLRTLFVTTAWYKLDDRRRAEAPLSGAVLAVDAGAQGRSEARFGG